MIRVNFLKLLCQSPNLRDKCRVLTNSIATSHVTHDRFVGKSKINITKEECFDKNKKNYEDTFGNLESFEMKFQRIKDDPEDILEYERQEAAQGKTMIQYIKEVKSHLDNHDYESALKVLEIDMVNDRKKVCRYIYKVLINYNAKIGNLKEAYRLFINFKKRQGIVTGAMYTSMFNACANCKNSYLALKKADAVQECLRKNPYHKINISNYNVMLKAYGRHGDLTTCLKIVDEVLATRNKVRADTYNFLLQSCVSDRNSGLRHALIVWRKMIQNRVKPDVWCFQTMLKCVKECSLGDVTLVPKIIEDIQKESGVFFKRKVLVRTLADGQKVRKALKTPVSGDDLITPVKDETSESVKNRNFIQIGNVETNPSSQLAIEGEAETTSNLKIENETSTYSQLAKEDNTSENLIESEAKDLEVFSSGNELHEPNESGTSITTDSEELEEYESTPVRISQKNSESLNLIAFKPTTGDVINFGVMTKPQHRFLLLGGVKGFLKTMSEFREKPNLKLFTLMLDVIPSDLESEEELLSIIKAEGLELDIAFFNCLIKRRIYRQEDSSVKDCLELMHSLNLKPDLITFGTLAIGCRTHELGMDLIRVLHNSGYRTNSEILDTLLGKAIQANDMKYILFVIKTAKEDETELNQKFFARMSRFVKNKKEKQEEMENILEIDSGVSREVSQS